MKRTRRLVVLAILTFVASAWPSPAKDQSPEWQPIPPEEMAVKDCPNDPGCSAIILYREENDDNLVGTTVESYRIKILTEEGKKYADVEIPFIKGCSRVTDIVARTIEPDGKAVDFSGDIFEKTLMQKGGSGFLAESFSLPILGVGSIIEYRYKIWWPPYGGSCVSSWMLSALPRTALLSDSWEVQRDLFTRRAIFSTRPGSQGGMLAWTWNGLPPGVEPFMDHGLIKLEVRNVPAFQREEFMPPEEEVRERVRFFHVDSTAKGFKKDSNDWYWKNLGERWSEYEERLSRKSKALEQAASGTFDAKDSPDVKLRKLYARVQKMRNLEYERERTEVEEKREKLKENHDATEVFKHGYGDSYDLTLLFVALARSAGFEAHIVWVTRRDLMFFAPAVMTPRQFTDVLAEVNDGSTTYYLAPALPFCPFGLLPWEFTGVMGMRLGKKESNLIKIPSPRSEDAVLKREAKFQVDKDGTVRGDLQVVFQGREALKRRLDNREQDQSGKRKALEDEVEGELPLGATAELKNTPNWDSSEAEFTAEFALTIPKFAIPMQRRLLLSPAVFQSVKKYPFQTSKRLYPIYFHFPYQVIDDVSILPPPGYTIEALPSEVKETMAFGTYEVAYENRDGSLHLHRKLVMQNSMIPLNLYSALRVFFDKARAGDEQEAVLKSESMAQAK
jgi:hypothetical protein